jgi:outer membrane protein
MNRLLCISVLWLGVLCAGTAGAQEILTLELALRLTAEHSMEADVGRLDVVSAKLGTDQAESFYYPRLDLSTSHVNLDNAPYFVAGPIVFPSAEKAYWQYSITASEVLWDGGRRSWAMKASRAREKAVALSGGESVRKAQAEVAGRYVALLTLMAQQDVVAMRKKALEDHLRIVQDLFQQGVVARNDLLRTEVALRSVGDQASSLEAARATASEALNKAMGLAPKTQSALPHRLPPPPPIAWDDEMCRQRALQNNEGLKALTAKAQALQDTVTLNQRDFYPSLVAEYGHSYTQNRYLLYPYVNSLFVGLSFNVFDGGAKTARVRMARAEVAKAQREITEAQRAVEVAVGQQLREFKESLKETGTARANMDSAAENLRIIEDQYKEGLARTIDVLDAESVLAESRFSEAQTYYQAYAKQAALLAAMGEDLPSFYGSLEASASAKEDDHGRL